MQANDYRPYQGYPYQNPPVNDVPSIDSATAARWNNLPRKQVELPVKRTEPVVYINTPNANPEPVPSPVVYMDMPEASGSQVSTGRRASSHSNEELEPGTNRRGFKGDPADDPVVYIDMPEGNCSVVQSPQNEDTEYVQETIFFDPFENRRIGMNKDETQKDSESEDDVSTLGSYSRRHPLPPITPNTLELYGAGSSGASTSNPSSSTCLPPLMSKEAMLYQGREEGFPTPSIPVSEFPEPPPAYTEIDKVRSPAVDPAGPVVEQPRREEPPRTQVILPRDHAQTTPIGLPNPDRKNLNCHHCGTRVHTLVIMENGNITHAIAIMCLVICMIPCVAFIYCTDYLKIKNHYCPSCNKIIGYEHPLSGNKIVYVN